MAGPHVLLRLDGRPIADNPHELRAFLPVRNEAARLPWFLEHHRRLGIDRFFVVDNGSEDGTVELLLTPVDRSCGDGWSSVNPTFGEQRPSDAGIFVGERDNDDHRRLSRQHPADPGAPGCPLW